MRQFDVVIVGGGPAGSACAAKLVDSGVKVAVLDREDFPRTKLCAGWITPEVVEDLDLDVEAYPCRFNTFEHIVVHMKGLTFNLDSPQHSIRRYEFDDFLLKRSGAEVIKHNVKNIEKKNGTYIVDDTFECRHLVGAAGTRCPVYRSFFREANPRAKELQAATYEHEFAYQWADPRCHLWFFRKGLPGYAWYVPKENGYLNCGMGGISHKRGFEYAPKGYSYFLRGGVDVVRVDNAFIAGDSVGLATRDLCEGIGPAVRSGHRAAESIVNGAEYSLESIDAYSVERGMIRNFLEYMIVKRKR
jgi:flavin-dependent dehydrogenase